MIHSKKRLTERRYRQTHLVSTSAAEKTSMPECLPRCGRINMPTDCALNSSELNSFCSTLYTETKSTDLSVDAPLRDASGHPSHNPVPASPAFQGVVKKFWREHEADHNRVDRRTEPPTRL